MILGVATGGGSAGASSEYLARGDAQTYQVPCKRLHRKGVNTA